MLCLWKTKSCQTWRGSISKEFSNDGKHMAKAASCVFSWIIEQLSNSSEDAVFLMSAFQAGIQPHVF